MPLPFVALDLPAELSPELVSSTLSGCNRALGSGRCVLADGPNPPERAVAWVASLRLVDAAETAVRIEVRTTPAPGGLVAVRELQFHPSDAPAERWTAAGVVIAALVIVDETADRRSKPAPAPPAAAAKAPARSSANRAPHRRPSTPDRRTRQVRESHAHSFELPIDLAALAGPGVEHQPWRVGGQLRVAAAWSGFPAFGWTALTVAHHQGTVSASWFSGAMGVGVRVPMVSELVALDGRLGIVATLVEFSTENVTQSDHTSRWRSGGVGAVDLVILASRHLQTVVSFEAAATWPRIIINRESTRVGQEPLVGWAVLGGLRWIP